MRPQNSYLLAPFMEKETSRRLGRYLSLMILLFILSTCDKNQPLPTAQQIDRFCDAYIDYLVAATADTAKIANRQSYFNAALDGQNLSESEFFAVLDYLKGHPEELERIIVQVDERLRHRQQQADSTRKQK